jgi:putative ABC transport system permease protein
VFCKKGDSQLLENRHLSFLIAMHAAWYVGTKWLLNYEIHTGIPWWIFVASGSTALLLTLITVSFQAIRAGLSNPVRSLRSE